MFGGWYHSQPSPVTPTETQPIERPDPRYPLRCPRCRREAYIGLNQIDHRYTGDNEKCR